MFHEIYFLLNTLIFIINTLVNVSKKNSVITKRRRRKDKAAGDDADEEGESGDEMEICDAETEPITEVSFAE